MSSAPPPPPNCVACDTPIVPGATRSADVPDGHRRHAGRGLCVRCYGRDWWHNRKSTPLLRETTPTRPATEDERVAGWKLHAACRDHDPDLFTPAGDDYTAAARVCNGDPETDTPACTVRHACLRYALRTETPATRHGMYGGLTPRQRARLTQEKTA